MSQAASHLQVERHYQELWEMKGFIGRKVGQRDYKCGLFQGRQGVYQVD